MKSVVFTESVYDIPYIAKLDRGVFDYLDLRTHPTKIDELPELKKEPRLKPLVSVLNDPSGMFITHACAIASRRPGIPGSTEIRIPYGSKGAPCWYSSYLFFSFYFLNQNKREHYEALHESYPSDKNECNVCFEVEPAYFWTPQEQVQDKRLGTSETNGTICGIWVSGWGSNAKEAQNRWSSGIDDLIAFFTNLPSNLKGCWESTGITISQHMFVLVQVDEPKDTV
jgi:hypothetical protein